MPGIKHVDIADDVALSAFRDTVAVAWFAPGKQPFDYSVSSFKRVGKWAEIHKYRLTLAALLRASHGHLLRQKKLSSQLLVFLLDHDVREMQVAELAAYNIRLMLSHLGGRTQSWAYPRQWRRRVEWTPADDRCFERHRHGGEGCPISAHSLTHLFRKYMLHVCLHVYAMPFYNVLSMC